MVRSALCLARAYPSGEHRKIRGVVAEMDVPRTFASQILSDLVCAGLASSKAGKDASGCPVPPRRSFWSTFVEAGEGEAVEQIGVEMVAKVPRSGQGQLWR